MTLDEALALIHAEGYPELDCLDALYVEVRMGDDPGPERIRDC